MEGLGRGRKRCEVDVCFSLPRTSVLSIFLACDANHVVSLALAAFILAQSQPNLLGDH